MKFEKKCKRLISEATGPQTQFSLKTLTEIEKKIKKLKPADIDEISGNFGLNIDNIQTTDIFNDNISYLADGKNLQAFFNIEHNGKNKAGVLLSFDIKTRKIVDFEFGGAGAWG